VINSSAIPWPRIIAEGAAIVASILLAFAIDAWWDERALRIEEREILESLQAEYEANRQEVASVVRIHELSAESTASLMSLSEGEILALPGEAVESYLRYFANPRTFDPIRGSTDALINSGKMGILQDRQLREALTTFINIVEDATEDRDYMTQWSMAVWQEVARNGGPYRRSIGNLEPEECADREVAVDCYIRSHMNYLPAATPDDLLRLRSNQTLMGYVNRNKENSMRYAFEMRRAQSQIDHILNLLQQDK